VSLLTKYDPPKVPGREQPPAWDLETEEQEYEVAAILDSKEVKNRKKNGPPTKVEYLVEWEGYQNTAQPRTWEPYDNLLNARQSLREFHRLYRDKPRDPQFTLEDVYKDETDDESEDT